MLYRTICFALAAVIGLSFRGPAASGVSSAEGPGNTALTINTLAEEAHLNGSQVFTNGVFGWSMAVDGDLAVVGTRQEDAGGVFQAGSAYVFARGATGWAQTARLVASNPDWQDGFGWAVAISGDTIVVGAPCESSSATGVNGNQADNSVACVGAAYVFVLSSGVWTQQAYLKPSNTSPGSSMELMQFGSSVAIFGDTVCVGAFGESSAATGVGGNDADNSAYASGAAYVFERSGITWSPQAYLKASNTDIKDLFGASVAVGAGMIAVGAREEQSKATGINGNQADNSGWGGAVYVFDRTGAAWAQSTYIKASDEGGDFGESLAFEGDTLVVGAPVANQAKGAAWVFVRSSGQWAQEAELKPFDLNPTWNHALGRFGASVAIDQDRILVGAPSDLLGGLGVNGTGKFETSFANSDFGAAHLFSRAGSVWSHVASLRLEDPGSYGAPFILDGDSFGQSVALVGDSLLVGRPGDRVGAFTGGGSVIAFNLNAACGSSRFGDFAGANMADLYGAPYPVEGSSFEFRFVGFGIVGTAMLVISSSSASVPLLGGSLLVDPAFSVVGLSVLPVAVFSPFAGSYSIAIPLGLAGQSFFAQMAMFAPGGPQGLIFTNGVEVTVCP